jgi:multidrug efflux system outer membrane protein
VIRIAAEVRGFDPTTHFEHKRLPLLDRVSQFALVAARYRAGIDPFLNVLDAQRSFYIAQQATVLTRLAAAQNLVDLYQSIGGDTLLQETPVCQALPGDHDRSAASAARK